MADMEFKKRLDQVDELYNDLYELRQRGDDAGKEEIVLAEMQFDGLRVCTERLQGSTVRYLCKELYCGRPRLVAAGGRDFAPGLTTFKVFPHFEQLVVSPLLSACSTDLASPSMTSS